MNKRQRKKQRKKFAAWHREVLEEYLTELKCQPIFSEGDPQLQSPLIKFVYPPVKRFVTVIVEIPTEEIP